MRLTKALQFAKAIKGLTDNKKMHELFDSLPKTRKCLCLECDKKNNFSGLLDFHSNSYYARLQS